MEREHNERAWLAHQTAAMMRCDPKKFPKLEKLMHRRRVPGRKQTPEQQFAIVKMLNAAFGGNVVKKES
ncbi:MAG: hypothetical protein GEU91_18470 [Rhizobiales bacterium]|nr:hypothetical protein [Hyphomicrobiales bacterium]